MTPTITQTIVHESMSLKPKIHGEAIRNAATPFVSQGHCRSMQSS